MTTLTNGNINDGGGKALTRTLSQQERKVQCSRRKEKGSGGQNASGEGNVCKRRRGGPLQWHQGKNA